MPLIPINLKTGTLQNNTTKKESSVIVGIDLGTTNSLVAYIDAKNAEAVAIQNEENSHKLVPSIIHFGDNDVVNVGNDAKKQLVKDPQNTIYSVKRLMGKSYTDVANYSKYFGYSIIDNDTESLVKIKVNKRFYTPIELSSLILSQLKERAEKFLQKPVRQAVITVPAYFNDAQRQATRDAGKLAGLEVLRIINEPTAASLAYGIGANSTKEQNIAVYDLGGGTFDISILSIDNGIFEVLSTNGDTFLGGDDIDHVIIDYWLEKNRMSASEIEHDKKLSQALRLLAEKAKISLGKAANFSEQLAHMTCAITRDTFNVLLQPLIDKTLHSCKQALKDAKLSTDDIDEVVLVGGSTRIPLVKQAVSQFFKRTAHDKLNPDEVVALGAAVQADILAGNNKEFLLLDITPLSLGIETMGGLMDVLVSRNTKVPTKAGRQYTTQVDGQSKMKIAVYQGERDLVQHNRKLGEFELSGIPAMPAGLPKVSISFIIDADGILRVKAQELRSGVSQSIVVKSQYGLSEEEMALMLVESIQHASSDRDVRALQEAINEAQHLASTAKRFVEKNSAQLSTEEIDQTKQLVDAVYLAINGKEKDKILLATTALNDYTKPFAHRLMDVAIAGALQGKKV